MRREKCGHPADPDNHIAPIGVGGPGETDNLNADTAAGAVAAAVKATRLLRVPHAILLELFAEGAGTLIRRQS